MLSENPSVVRLDRLAHVVYQHPDLKEACRFLIDFGLEIAQENKDRVYFKGFGQDPFIYVAEQSPTERRNFGGGGWVVSSYADLERGAALPGASSIEKYDAPGGGNTVTLKDPNGFTIRLIFGQAPNPVRTLPHVILNSALEKPRKGEFQRFKPKPSPVHKVGHYGVEVKGRDFKSTLEWYLTTFNLKITDSMYNTKTGLDELSFMHIDKGIEYTDHHSFFILGGPDDKSPHINHSSFEVHDMDSELLGHDWLRLNGWKNCWGVGRHLLGSQIFDYWFDASGNVIEHYSDGDLVNSENKPSREEAGTKNLSMWGPDVPLAFITGRVEDVGRELILPIGD